MAVQQQYPNASSLVPISMPFGSMFSPHLPYVPLPYSGPAAITASSPYGQGIPVQQGSRDMDSLKEAISRARAGEVRYVLEKASFVVGDKAFTALINKCGSAGEPLKALEVFQFVENKLPTRLNVYIYTAAIAAVGAHDWRKAEELFEKAREHGARDPVVAPNVFTYSAIISVYEKAGLLDKAITTYEHMLEADIVPDHVLYSSVISIFARAGQPDRAIEMVNKLHKLQQKANIGAYNCVLKALGQTEGVQEVSAKAAALFADMQARGVEANQKTWVALARTYSAVGDCGSVQQLLSMMDAQHARPDADCYGAAVLAAARAGELETATQVLHKMRELGLHVPPEPARLAPDALRVQGMSEQGDTLEQAIQALGIATAPSLPSVASPTPGSTPAQGSSASTPVRSARAATPGSRGSLSPTRGQRRLPRAAQHHAHSAPGNTRHQAAGLSLLGRRGTAGPALKAGAVVPYATPAASMATVVPSISQAMAISVHGQAMSMHGMHYWPTHMLPPHVQQQQLLQYDGEQAGMMVAFDGSQLLPLPMYPLFQPHTHAGAHPGPHAHGFYPAHQFAGTGGDYGMWQTPVAVPAHLPPHLPGRPRHPQQPGSKQQSQRQQQQHKQQRSQHQGRQQGAHHGGRFPRRSGAPEQVPTTAPSASSQQQ